MNTWDDLEYRTKVLVWKRVSDAPAQDTTGSLDDDSTLYTVRWETVSGVYYLYTDHALSGPALYVFDRRVDRDQEFEEIRQSNEEGWSDE